MDDAASPTAAAVPAPPVPADVASNQRIARWRIAALALAVVVFAASLVMSIAAGRDRRDAIRQQDRARAELQAQQVVTQRSEAELQQTRAKLQAVNPATVTALTTAQHLVQLQDQVLAAEQDAVTAGVAAQIGNYDRAIDRSNGVVDELNTTQTQLATQITQVQTALEGAAPK